MQIESLDAKLHRCHNYMQEVREEMLNIISAKQKLNQIMLYERNEWERAYNDLKEFYSKGGTKQNERRISKTLQFTNKPWVT